VANRFARTLLCAVVLLWAGSLTPAGELDRTPEIAVRARSCTFRVHPPRDDAKLYFEGRLVRATGIDRTFYSPPLEEGKHYAYKVVAVWIENDREVTHEMHVKFWAGDDVTLDFRR
jgi:uncharacterized protein (TIGR03000 family)